MDVKVRPARYQSRPVAPTQVEAILLTEDNLQEAADWLNSFPSHDLRGRPREAVVRPDPASGAQRILSPFFGGSYACYPGDYLVHFGGGDARGMSADDFELDYEARPPGDPAMCECLNPRAEGIATGGDPVAWDKDCKLCGKKLTPEALANVTAGAE